MDPSEVHPQRINAKEVLTPQRRENFMFPVADVTAKLSGGDHEFREPTPRREQPVGSEDISGELQGELEGPQPTETKDDAEARKDFWSMEGDFISRHHVEPPPVQLCVPREETFPIPLKYIDVTRTSRTNPDVLQEKRIYDNWNVDVDRSLTDSWTGFTKFYRTKNFPKDICGPGSGLPRLKQLPDLIVCGQKLGLACQKQLRKRKGKNGLQKNQSSTALENRERLLHRSRRWRA